MILADLLNLMKSQNAVIVHCSRSNRGGELSKKPIYPNDLKHTIRDLATGNVRNVSCSVVWPDHQQTFGEIGIIVKPRNVDEIVRLSNGDGGTLEDGQGIGDPLSSDAVNRTFTESIEHNEWVLNGGEVVGIFLNFGMGLYVARLVDNIEGMPAEQMEMLGISSNPLPFSITAAEVAADFPDLRLFGFIEGRLMEIDPNGEPIEPCHPY